METLARGADLFICEATLESDGDEEDRPRSHLSPWEAGAMASAAGVERLVLTHLPPHRDRETALRAARSVFRGDIVVAREGDRFTVE